ncbi:hypothetical protein PROFUN_05982 [Planoprotostelium fungivorum]|uniref:Homeobox domain-containing protein n=1 Tax=Planoprotostelium fungivorum TaxID=1890364 RepID=A0A2P6NPA7_9EUKA|nr:hypothetical protein PROFUN_05982 [Planoprotostelium fungivorum]
MFLQILPSNCRGKDDRPLDHGNSQTILQWLEGIDLVSFIMHRRFNQDSDFTILSNDLTWLEAWRYLRKRKSMVDDGRLHEYRTTPQQAAVLKELFSRNPTPDRRELKSAADMVDMPEQRVRTWYRNRRSKESRRRREEELMQRINRQGEDEGHISVDIHHDPEQERENPRDPRMSIKSIDVLRNHAALAKSLFWWRLPRACIGLLFKKPISGVLLKNFKTRARSEIGIWEGRVPMIDVAAHGN